MKNFLAKIWIPALLVASAGWQAFGIDITRAVSYKDGADTLVNAHMEPDTTDIPFLKDSLSLTADTLALPTDSLPTPTDSLPALADSTMMLILAARDTIKAPDSLKISDPFFYKYYVAVKDSTTRVFVRDSLMTAGDTLGVLRLDSLYIKDSTDMAIARHNAWYAALSRKERRKYDAEQKLPALIAAANRKIAIKDSIRTRKDSII